MNALSWAGLILSVAALPLHAQSAKPQFDVASIKPFDLTQFDPSTLSPPSGLPAPPLATSFRRSNVTLASLVEYAYGITRWQVVDGPTWIREDRFQVEAKPASPASPDEMRLMLQSLLAERFELALRKDRREMRLFVLQIARSDRRLGKELTKCDPKLPPRSPSAPVRDGERLGRRCVPISSMVPVFARLLGAPVDNQTGLTGLWTGFVTYNDDLQAVGGSPTFAKALEEQFGLKVTARRGPVDVLVVERASRPSPN